MVTTLERAAVETGLPKTIRLDNGSEFVGKELNFWAFTRGVTLDFSRPGKPADNVCIESFNGRFRVEQAERELVPQPRRGAAKMRGSA